MKRLKKDVKIGSRLPAVRKVAQIISPSVDEKSCPPEGRPFFNKEPKVQLQ